MTTIAPTNDSFIDFKSSPSNANSSVCFTSPILEPVSPDVQPAIWMLYLFTSICSVLGNLLVILVQIFGRQSSRCIRKYLNNLAVSDITLALMSMPFMYSNIVLGHWTYPHFLCPVAQFAQLLTSFTTSSTLSIIGIERYIITLHPLSPGASWLKSKGSWLLISTWFLGAAYAYVPTSHTAVEDFILNGDLYQQCSYRFSLSPHKLRFIIVLNFVLTFLLPLVIITFSYVAIIRHLKEHHDFTVLYTNQYRQNQCQLMTVCVRLYNESFFNLLKTFKTFLQIQTHPPLVRRNSCSFKNRSKV